MGNIHNKITLAFTINDVSNQSNMLTSLEYIITFSRHAGWDFNKYILSNRGIIVHSEDCSAISSASQSNFQSTD